MTEWRRRFQDPSLVPSCADQSQFEVRGVLLCRSRSTCFSILEANPRSRQRHQAFLAPYNFIVIHTTSSAELLLSTRHGHDHPTSMVIPLLLCCLALFQSTNATNANKKQGATTATNSFTTATPASSSTTTTTFPRWHATNTTSFHIDPSIGDAVNIYRKFLEIEHLARTRTDTTAPLPTIFFNDMKQTMTATFNDKLQSLCSGLETISPTKNTTVYQDLVAAAQSLVRSNRHSSLAISLLGIVLSGADSINGEQSTEMTLRAFRRASQVNNVRLKTIQDLLETIQTTEPSSYPFVHEYYMRERRIYGRTFNLMGRLLFDLGEWKDSIVALESAVELDHSIPEAYEWLARAYDRDARPDDFFKAWHQALSVDPWASDRNVWPVFCVTIQHPSVPDTPRLSINRERKSVFPLVSFGVLWFPFRFPLSSFVVLLFRVFARHQTNAID